MTNESNESNESAARSSSGYGVEACPKRNEAFRHAQHADIEAVPCSSQTADNVALVVFLVDTVDIDGPPKGYALLLFGRLFGRVFGP